MRRSGVRIPLAPPRFRRKSRQFLAGELGQCLANRSLLDFPSMNRLLLLLPLFLISCAPLSKPSTTSGAIVLAKEEKRDCKKARVVLPAGVYTPEVQSETGTYYLAPAELRTERVLIGGSYRGGLFISNAGGQAAWFGDARDEADERPGTLLGAIGASSPKLWPFSPPVTISPAPSSTP